MKNYKIDIKLNKSITYMLGAVDTVIGFKFLNQIVNSYLFNNEKDLQFSVLYKFSGKIPFSKYEDELMKHELFIGHEDYGEYVLYKFKLPPEIEEVMNLFIDGSYSKYPIQYKNAIENFIMRRGASNFKRIRMIMDRDPAIRDELSKKINHFIPADNELSSPPDLKTETFSNYLEIHDTNGHT